MDTIKIKGAEMDSIKKGERAKLLLEGGRWILTTPIVDYFVANSTVFVETQNHTYISD